MDRLRFTALAERDRPRVIAFVRSSTSGVFYCVCVFFTAQRASGGAHMHRYVLVEGFDLRTSMFSLTKKKKRTTRHPRENKNTVHTCRVMFCRGTYLTIPRGTLSGTYGIRTRTRNFSKIPKAAAQYPEHGYTFVTISGSRVGIRLQPHGSAQSIDLERIIRRRYGRTRCVLNRCGILNVCVCFVVCLVFGVTLSYVRKTLSSIEVI